MKTENERERTPMYNFQPSDSVPSLHERRSSFLLLPFPFGLSLRFSTFPDNEILLPNRSVLSGVHIDPFPNERRETRNVLFRQFEEPVRDD